MLLGRMFIMEGMGKKPRRPRRAFTPEFKAEIVEVCRRGDRTVGQVARDFDLTETAVREWVRQADLDAGTRSDGLTSDEREELARLRRENRRLREDVDILKRATAFFAKETHRQLRMGFPGRGCLPGRAAGGDVDVVAAV
ncbi:transposase, partial [Micromonospora sp. KC207]|uniref:transposase n=1 Tax=Micromonospora sp. KC207 TaxID=2530377 RepID=UPI001050B145